MTTTIKISDELAQQIDSLVGFHGFTSRTDFVRKSVKMLIESIEEAKATVES